MVNTFVVAKYVTAVLESIILCHSIREHLIVAVVCIGLCSLHCLFLYRITKKLWGVRKGLGESPSMPTLQYIYYNSDDRKTLRF